MLFMACFSTRSVERQMQELVPDGQVCSRVATSLVKYLGIVFMPTHAGYGSCFHWVSPGKKKPTEVGLLVWLHEPATLFHAAWCVSLNRTLWFTYFSTVKACIFSGLKELFCMVLHVLFSK